MRLLRYVELSRILIPNSGCFRTGRLSYIVNKEIFSGNCGNWRITMYYLTDSDYAKAEANGIPKGYAYHRYYTYGWDLERALTEPVGAYKRITLNMELWDQWKETAETSGVTKQLFYNRLNKKTGKKWTPEEAATMPKGLRKYTTISPKIYELAEQNGIKVKTLRSRIFNQHWNPVRAATEPVNTLMFDEFMEY
jgi:hypothetical protein